MRALLTATLIWVAAAGSAASPPDPRLGERLYREGTLSSGAPVEVQLSTGAVLRGKAAACASCHRPSGFGGVEGGVYVPPVTGPYLFAGRENRRIDLFHALFQEELGFEIWARLRQRPPRPAYTLESLGVALASGHDPSGRTLDPLMPRYSLSADDLANLHACLDTLGARPDPGVNAESIRFATLVHGEVDTAAERARLAVLEAFVRLKNADTERLRQRPPDPLGHEEHFAPAYRRWELEVLEVDLSARPGHDDLAARLRSQEVFAVLAGPGGEVGRRLSAFCEEQSLPCLLLEDESGDGTRGAFVRHLNAAPCPPETPEPPQAFRARQWLRARGIAPGPAEEVALATHHLLTLTEAAVMHLLDDFSRAYFLESFDREAGRVESPLACRRAPGHRPDQRR